MGYLVLQGAPHFVQLKCPTGVPKRFEYLASRQSAEIELRESPDRLHRPVCKPFPLAWPREPWFLRAFQPCFDEPSGHLHGGT